MARLIYNLSLCLVLCLLMGCGAQQGISSIVVSPNPKTIGTDHRQQFYATAYDSAGGVVSTSFTWSADRSVGTIDANGLFYAASIEGTGSVVAAAEGLTGKSTVTVTAKGTISGTVFDKDRNGIQYITVYVSSRPSLSAITDRNGIYTISDVPTGTQEVDTMENLQYLKASVEANVLTGESKTVNFTLTNRLAVNDESFFDNPIFVSGTVKNQGATTVKEITVIYYFKDGSGTTIASGNQLMGDISAEASGVFTIYPTPLITEYTSYSKVIAAGSF